MTTPHRSAPSPIPTEIPALVDQLLASRRSIRAFSGQPVPTPLINDIIAQALNAPSWGNIQPYRIAIANGTLAEELRHEISTTYESAMTLTRNASFRGYYQAWRQKLLPDGDYSTRLKYPQELQRRYAATGNGLYSLAGQHVLLAPPQFNRELHIAGRVVVASLDIMRYSRALLLRNYRFDDGLSQPHDASFEVPSHHLRMSADPRFRTFFLSWWKQAPSFENLDRSLDQLINPSGAVPEKRVLDARIRQVMHIIYQRRGEKILIASLANAVNLSESRLRHLFKQEMHVSLGDLLTSWRLMGFLHDYCKFRSITYAAAEAGYADASHLNRAIQGLLGMPFSRLMACNPAIAFFSAFPQAAD